MNINSDWIAPTEFPDLSNREKIAIDLETCDPGLIKDGPGWPKKIGAVIGIAVASVLLLGAVRNQRARLAKVKDAGELTLSSILGERNSFPEDLNEKISDMESGLTRDKSRVSLWLALFEAGCSVPLLAAGGLMFWWYGSKIPLLVEALLERVCG